MTDRSSLAAHVDAMRGARVLCVGDVMLDRFVYGDVERISPEAPIPVMRIQRETSMLGGAGNVVRNMVALGARPVFVSVVGDDGAAREIVGLISALGGVEPCLVAEPGRQTTIKMRYIAGSQQLLRADRETTAAISDSCTTQVIERIAAALPKVDVVVLSDYGKGVLNARVLDSTIQAARAAGKPVIVDPKGSDYRIYRGASLLTPNRKELADASKLPVAGDGQIVAAARHLLENCGVEAILATRSQDGMTLVGRPDTVWHLPAEAREVFDVSGAGDTVVATIAVALAAGVPLEQAARLANAAAGIVVAKVGTAVAYSGELLAAIHAQELRHDEAKIQTLDGLLDLAARWRHRGWRVGFTNGCFDLLHPGHIALIRQAKAACDRLVVGLNADASVQRLKGPTRPVQSETARATVLASLEAVDAVVLFNEDTPLQLITALKPDVLVKGADYTIATVVGADVVQSYGGKVVLADLVQGQSTTATIARMK